MRQDALYSVPPNLPAPDDDGASAHLVGLALPSISLPATTGGDVNLAAGTTRFTVIYAYPRTGLPDHPSPPGWDDIPGARGCTPQNCAFRDHFTELRDLGAAVYGLSTQSTDYQREMAARLHLPFPVLSDDRVDFTRSLRLPTFRYRPWTLLKRLSLIAEGRRIVHVVYPVFPPHAYAAAVVSWLHARVR